MKEHPILFTDEMVRAILDGRKTQTRRVVKVQPPDHRYRLATCMSSTDRKIEGLHHWVHVVGNDQRDVSQPYFRCPYVVGDRLWGREAHVIGGPYPESPEIFYRATDSRRAQDVICDDYMLESIPWRPSIHMARRDSRITLEITDVRVERVQDISEEDAKAEGVESLGGKFFRDYLSRSTESVDMTHLNARESFKSLWDSINKKRGFGWDANPWAWATTFERVA